MGQNAWLKWRAIRPSFTSLTRQIPVMQRLRKKKIWLLRSINRIGRLTGLPQTMLIKRLCTRILALSYSIIHSKVIIPVSLHVCILNWALAFLHMCVRWLTKTCWINFLDGQTGSGKSYSMVCSCADPLLTVFLRVFGLFISWLYLLILYWYCVSLAYSVQSLCKLLLINTCVISCLFFSSVIRWGMVKTKG